MYVLGVFNEKLYLGFNLFVVLDIRAMTHTPQNNWGLNQFMRICVKLPMVPLN